MKDLLDEYAIYLGDDARLLTPEEAEQQMCEDVGFQHYIEEQQ